MRDIKLLDWLIGFLEGVFGFEIPPVFVDFLPFVYGLLGFVPQDRFDEALELIREDLESLARKSMEMGLTSQSNHVKMARVDIHTKLAEAGLLTKFSASEPQETLEMVQGFISEEAEKIAAEEAREVDTESKEVDTKPKAPKKSSKKEG